MEIIFSHQALLDLEEIEFISVEKWGKKVAEDYISAIEQAVNLLQQNPNILFKKEDISFILKFYRVKQHFLVCDIIGDTIYILTIKHGNMDLPERIAEVEPYLIKEAQILHKRLIDKK